MALGDVFQNLAIAAGLGLLVGFQRERAETRTAGIRTFPLIALFGAFAGLLAQHFGSWVVPAALLAVAAMVALGHWIQARDGDVDPGITTDVAALLMFAVGAALVAGYTAPAVVVAGTVAVLLHWKKPLHRFARRLGEADSHALFRLVLIALVILPVLPDRSYGPYEVLNPREIWLMVVLIVGISIVAFVAYRLLGARSGTILSGILGGLISSTASTVSYARGARLGSLGVSTVVVLVMISSTVVFGRVIAEIAIVAPGSLPDMAPPLIVLMVAMAGLSTAVLVSSRRDLTASTDSGPPSDLRGALVFGALYAVVLLGVALAHEHLGMKGLYAVAALSGLTDMDAITLSTAQLVRGEQLDPSVGWRLIVVGAMANLAFKAAVVFALGTARLFGKVALLFGLCAAAGAALLVLWG